MTDDQGQLTLSRDVTARLGVGPGQAVELDVLDDGLLRLRTGRRRGTRTWRSVAGCAPNPEGIHLTVEEISKSIAAGWAGEAL
ncbi:MAG: hypothetical protein FWD59_02280 [Micrococcales bacterium]|nr:hypothetical protein [Micrococcales bacterium]